MDLEFYEESQLGSRKNNQDYYSHLIEKDFSCFVIADGLGGHQKGEVAAKEYCDSIINQAKQLSKTIQADPLLGLEKLVSNAHREMQDKIQKQYGLIDCHTTFALAWIANLHLLTAHVGDSRVFRLDSSGVLWRTPDHTMVQQLFDEGKISEEEFASHPMQNRLLKTVNLYELPEPDIFLHPPLTSEETLLLCTDGFWTHLTPSDFKKIVKSKTLNKTIKTKISNIVKEHVLDADNVTVQVIRKLT